MHALEGRLKQQLICGMYTATITSTKSRRGAFCLSIDELSIAPREVFAVVGETGAGKTVLLEAIAGAFPLEDGAILLDGKDVSTLPVQQRHLGILYQDHALFPHLSVRDNIGYGLKMAKTPKAESNVQLKRTFHRRLRPCCKGVSGKRLGAFSQAAATFYTVRWLRCIAAQ